MKKLIGILMLLLIGIVSMAQRNINLEVKPDKYAAVYNTDLTLVGNDTIVNYIVNFQTANPYLYDVSMKLDSVGTGAYATVILSGKLWDTSTYVNIDTVAWKGTSSDTSFTITQHTTKAYYQYFKAFVEGDSCRVDYFKQRIWK